MSNLADIQEKLQDTVGMLAVLEGELARHPDVPSLLLNIRSVEKRKKKLEADLAAATSALGLEICSYRILPGEQRAKLAGLTSVLGNYQSLVSLVYDALRHGPKRTAKVNADAVAETAFDFAYAFAGSVGFVFTAPNEPTFFDNTTLDETIRLIFKLARASEPEEVLGYARQLGPAPIRVLYRWAESHVKALFSADIEWRRGQNVRQKALIQELEFQKLQEIINRTSEETHQELVVTGELVGVDVSARSFHLKPAVGEDIRGGSGGVIGSAHTVEVPRRYKVTLRKTTKVYFSTDQEEVHYEMLVLESL